MWKIVAVLLSLMVLIGIVMAIMSIRNQSQFQINRGAAVVKQLNELKRYETASFTIEQIIDAGTDYSPIKELLIGDQILLIAHGEVVAGFDFSTVSEKDIQVRGATVEISLPPPMILSTRLDSELTRVYDRRQGLLTRGDKDLETQARTAAEDSIRQAACQKNILDEATKNARTQLTGLLKALGFETVIIKIPQGSC